MIESDDNKKVGQECQKVISRPHRLTCLAHRPSLKKAYHGHVISLDISVPLVPTLGIPCNLLHHIHPPFPNQLRLTAVSG